MIKKLAILTIIIASTNLINAHCGTCGTGEKKEHKKHHKTHQNHNHLDKLNLTNDQVEKHDELTKKYNAEIKKLKDKYEEEFQAILTNKQMKMYTRNSTDECKLCKVK